MNYDEYNKEYIQDMLMKMNTCDTQCKDLGTRPYTLDKDTITDVDWLISHLPSYNYVVDRMLNYMFADGMATGDEESKDTLDKWMNERKNARDNTNYAELRECIRRAIGYGESGLRHYNGDVYVVPLGKYGRLVDTVDGIERTVLFYISKKGESVDTKIDKTDWDQWKTYEDAMRWFDEEGYILMDPKDFIVLERNPADPDAGSPLLTDKDRLDLITAVYAQLNYDIRYDGPGRTFFRLKSGWAEGDENDISTGQVLGNTPEQKEERLKNAKAEIEKLLAEVKNSSSDSIGVLSNAFDEDYIHLPRVTKATEFLSWAYSNETTIIAQVLGMSPTLLETGRLHGNISVQHIIDNAMLNTIVPMRDMFATQFSSFIAKIAGVPKAYFDKYNMAQVDNENDTRKDLATVIKDLSIAVNNLEGDEEVTRVINEVADVLRSSLYDEQEQLKKI